MDTNRLGVVECLDKYEVEYGDKDAVECLYEGVLACLDKNDKNGFEVDFIHLHPLEEIREETLGDQFLFQHGYMQKIDWCDTYVHFCYHHNYKHHMIYLDNLNDGREKGWSDTKIH